MSTPVFDLVVLGDCNPDLILSGEQVELAGLRPEGHALVVPHDLAATGRPR